MKKGVIIIGAGASGLMCAIEAGKRGRSVLVFDHAGKAARKIRVSGGGRCNFTNLNVGADNYVSGNHHFCKSALARFTPHDFIALVERHGITFAEREPGQLFCTRSSQDIVDMLRKECVDCGVEIRLGCKIDKVVKGNHFRVSTSLGAFESGSLVVATGGLSYPKLGATDLGHRLARQFGLAVTEVRPALVPFTFSPEDLKVFRELSGVSVDAAVACNKGRFRGNILFTHRGLSGPAILQVSLYWNPGDVIAVDLLPDLDIYELLTAQRHSAMEIRNVLSQHLPRRLSRSWCEAYIRDESVKPVTQIGDKRLRGISAMLHDWKIKPNGSEGYRTAEVTLGGVDTNELSSKTMESKKVPGLFFIGEVVDVTGQLGGYNLQWAWASGYVAGQYV